jgi:hypothetical protein
VNGYFRARLVLSACTVAAVACTAGLDRVDASGGNSGSGGLAPMTGAGGSGAAVVPGLALDAGPVPGDAGTVCSNLSIGILGNPGSNASSDFQAWLEARGTSARRILTAPDGDLTAATLQPFDVVVIDLPPREFTADEASIFAAWVSAGGGFASMSGYHNDTAQDWRANSLLAPLGLAYSGQLLWGPVTQFGAHPIVSGLTSVTFQGGYAISDLGGSTGTRTPVAFISSNGANVAVGYTVQAGAGRGFVWGDEWIEFDSEWAAIPQIPQEWLQVFAWIAPANRCKLTGIGFLL